MSKDDPFGDRMKVYEQAEAGRRALPLLPLLVRLDGRSFSKWTRGLDRPFDAGLSRAMVETTKFLVEESKALLGYTQSDEMTLLLHADRYDSEVFFDGKLQKLVSVLASLAAAKFNALVPTLVPKKTGALAAFDCRAWTVPNEDEAANAFLWREADATKNSVAMAAQSLFSHRELDRKSLSDMQEMLFRRGVNWNDYPDAFKRGTFVRRRTFERELEPEVLAKVPEAKRPPPGTKVKRSEVVEVPMPPFRRVTNRVGFVFRDEAPVLASAESA